MTRSEINDNVVPECGNTDIAIFPLKLVHFPGAALPLKIFELRYAEMTKVCLRDDVPFGVCLIRNGNEVGTPAEHALIGCSTRIADWEMPHPNLFHLGCVGENVFRVVNSRIEKTGLIRGEVQWLSEDNGNVDANDLDVCRTALAACLEGAGEAIRDMPAFGDPAWVSYRLAEILPLKLHTRQELLEQRSTALRLSRIAELMESA